MTTPPSSAALLAGLLVLSSAATAVAQPAPPPAAPAAVAPREIAGRVAKAIEDVYFDAAKGKVIATDLRAAVDKGEFDRFTDPRDLATALTARLSPIDHHFNVGWTPPSAGGAGGPPHGPGGPVMVRRGPPGGPQGADPMDRRANFGFRRVEALPGGIGYVDMRQFANFAFGQTDEPARQAVDAVLTLLTASDAVIIDLRENGGGSPAMVGYLVSAFTPKDADIYNTFRTRDGTSSESPREYFARPRLDVPVYVLISARTGSAAEAFAYTMKAAKRATIVGEASGGAANPGGRAPLGDGWSVFVSSGSPVNPVTGGNWEGGGVQPDVAVLSADALNRARQLALEALLAKKPSGPTAVDTQWALESLRAELNPPAAIAGLDDYVGTYNGDLVVRRVGASLVMQRGRRPAATLLPLGDGVFFVQGEPARRVAFERDASGKVVAMDLRSPGGPSVRFRPGG